MGKRKNARHIAPSVLVLGEASQAFPEIVEILDNDSGTLLDLIQRPLPNTKFGKNLAIEDNMLSNIKYTFYSFPNSLAVAHECPSKIGISKKVISQATR